MLISRGLTFRKENHENEERREYRLVSDILEANVAVSHSMTENFILLEEGMNSLFH